MTCFLFRHLKLLLCDRGKFLLFFFFLLTYSVSQMSLNTWMWMAHPEVCLYFHAQLGEATCRTVSESISLFLT